MMRLFVALEPSPSFRDALSGLQDRLRDAGVTGRWLEKDNLHLTLAFIGMWPEDVSALLPQVPEPFPVMLSHLGVFPEADVLWAGVEPCAPLDRLAGQVRQALEEAGIPFDRKAFFPHITLARKPRIPADIDLSRIGVQPAAMTVREVCLYRSKHGEKGMVYTVIGRSREAY